jgi:hypothetical protein
VHVLVILVFGLLAAQSSPQILETQGDLVSVEEYDVGDSRSVDGEEAPIDYRVGRAEVSRRILHIFFMIIQPLLIEGPRNVVAVAEVVPDLVGVLSPESVRAQNYDCKEFKLRRTMGR